MFTTRFIQMSISYMISEISQKGVNKDDLDEIVYNLFTLLKNDEAISMYFTLDELQTVAYYFYSYLNFKDEYPELDKFFRNSHFPEYVYNKSDDDE